MAFSEPAELADHLVATTTGALELFAVHLGGRLGLYRWLAEAGPSTPADLAEGSGIAERYAREWLEQQAVAGLLEASDEPDGDRRTYALPEALRPVLVDPEDPLHVAPLADLVVGIAGVLDRLTTAYRTGEGVPYEDYGPIFRGGQAGINRPAFTHETGDWLAAMPDVAEHLSANGGRVADVACGEGWSTIALARWLPDARVDGYDADAASIEEAVRHAADAGVSERTGFHLVDASADDALGGPYDLVTVFEALHDVARPVEMLAGIRRALAPGGTVLVADERVADEFTADLTGPAGDVERLMYGWSVTHCLPAAMVSSPSAALGTVLRAPQVRRLAAEAGYVDVEVLPIENDFFRFYRLRA
jgi:SAM-dependent methyltransferase